MIFPFSISYTWHFDAELLSDEEILQRFEKALHEKRADIVQRNKQNSILFNKKLFSNKHRGGTALMSNIDGGYITIIKEQKMIKSKIHIYAPLVFILLGVAVAYFVNGTIPVVITVAIFLYSFYSITTYLSTYKEYDDFINKIIDEELY